MKKFLIKYKFSFNLFIGYASILGPLAVMINLDYIYEIPDGVNAAVGIGITVFWIVWLIYFTKNYPKIIKQREKDKLRKIKKIAHSKKSAVLVRKRAIFGNLSFVFGLLSFYTAWLLLFPSNFNSAGFWIFRGCSVVLTAFGAILSWVIPRKMLIYKGGVLIIDNGEINKSINPDELSGWERILEKRKGSNTIAWSLLYYDLALNINGEEIILKKADSEYDFCFKKTIQTIKNTTTDKPVQTERGIK